MPQTSTKQPSMKLNYVKHLQKVDSESFIKETEEASMNVVDITMQHRTVRPLYQESELSRQQILEDFSVIMGQIKKKPVH